MEGMRMSFDFSKVIADVQKRVSNEEGSQKKDYRYKIVYPSEGKLRVRILFNPASGLITRLVSRHTIGKNKYPCMNTYTSKDDCPICQALAESEKMGHGIPYSMKSKTRAICLAQYHSSSYEIEGLKQGDIFLLMVPWSVYKDGICKWLNDFADDPQIMAKVFGHHEANVFIIEHGKDITDWSGRPDPNVTINSAADDDAFAKLLEDQDSLYNLVDNIHEQPTDDDKKLMQSVAEDLRKSIVNPKNATATEMDSAQVQSQEAQPVSQPAVQPTAQASTTPPASDKPFELSEEQKLCFGKLYTNPDETDPTKIAQKIKCKFCPVQGDCKTLKENS